ncbi:MAG TPA: SDR family NAD(P)-dependent oxidoreductase [Solirubrobacteraceae bacterium]|nr:SDR family NAD(P)-dependent oxidoreductase [Solirubrobacteraceae bacterium]
MTSISSARISGWGGGAGATVRVMRPDRVDELSAALDRCRARGFLDAGAIARGMGRSYGDAAQLEGGLVLETARLRGFELDAGSGTVTAEAGVTIAELLDALVPAGWMVPVVPGTQHVSVGGAIAGDIHGKNHGVAGTFGSHVDSLELLTASGDVLELSAADADPLFYATVGGMGLTGVILRARIRLRAVSSPVLSVDTDRVHGLDEILAALTTSGGSYRVAWVDLLGARPGRGVVTRAEHLAAGDVPSGAPAPATVKARVTVPSAWPAGLLRPATVGAFNELRFRRTPRRERGRTQSIGEHMFPLDAIAAWPRLYGPKGFVQYQLVVPFGAERVLDAVIEQLRRTRVPCYLAVLKDFGDANRAPLSFPIAGWTLTLDLPRSAEGLERLLQLLDELVAQAGGRVYLSKDDRMRPDALAAMYPRLDEWRDARDRADPAGLWRSDLGQRTGLIQSAAEPRGRPVRPLASSGRRVLLLGGSSEIGLAIVRRLLREGPVRPYLIGRERDRLAAALADLERAGCAAGALDVVDAERVEDHAQALDRAFAAMDGFDLVVLAVGALGAQSGLDADPDEILAVMRVNFTGAGSLLIEALRRLRDQGCGALVVLSSVAAERPRAGNAIYGAAKAGLDALAQGLADATAGSGVRVLVVRPGFVSTKMTAGLKPAPMATTPQAVADTTVAALTGRAHTIWAPRRLRLVFAVLRHLPRRLYRRLPL